MTVSKLAETGNLLDLYLYHTGKSEVPKTYHFWCALAAMAGCVSDRVFMYKFRTAKLIPNLYTILVGPSTLGKGTAIDVAMPFIKDLPRAGVYRGKASAPYLIDYLGRPHKGPSGKMVLDSAKMMLVTPELSMSVGSGPLADAFIKHMTELYTGGDYLLQEGTRTRGGVQIKNPVINWLAGSTREWLKDSITKDAIEGGFFSRTVCVQANYDFSVRYPRPIYPPDYDEVRDHLAARFRMLTHVEGLMTLSKQAEAREELWYRGREAPSDLRLAPIWKRSHDVILKIAMLLALAEPDLDMTITLDHWEKAVVIVREVHKYAPDLIALAQVTPETQTIVQVEEMLKRHGRIPHSMLLKNTGVTKDRLREAVDTLLARRQIMVVTTQTGGAMYVWRKRTAGLAGVNDPEIADGEPTN